MILNLIHPQTFIEVAVHDSRRRDTSDLSVGALCGNQRASGEIEVTSTFPCIYDNEKGFSNEFLLKMKGLHEASHSTESLVGFYVSGEASKASSEEIIEKIAKEFIKEADGSIICFLDFRPSPEPSENKGIVKPKSYVVHRIGSFDKTLGVVIFEADYKIVGSDSEVISLSVISSIVDNGSDIVMKEPRLGLKSSDSETIVKHGLNHAIKFLQDREKGDKSEVIERIGLDCMRLVDALQEGRQSMEDVEDLAEDLDEIVAMTKIVSKNIIEKYL
eukprot:gnl/Carplike_NY0171/1943_a2631_980.p1 GENE.gnl/Carplike_NY0171/1943_a2631_980~~gnl/Carplike_NY0171/1943_a2631_980.p1  ORF type:complete len:274 (+),score=67.17 gnl/Carplike_NY0171/1943_a2631_980:52-873(+)